MESRRKCVACMWSKLVKLRFNFMHLFAIVLVLLCMNTLIFGTYFITANAINHKHLYPETAIVIDIDETEDIVTVECANGNRFSFFGIEDYMHGDLVALTMYDNGTSIVYDDKIVDDEYAGYADLFLEIENTVLN